MLHGRVMGVADALEGLSVSSLTPAKASASLKHACELTPRQRRNAKRISTPAKHASYGGGSRKYLYKQETTPDVFDGVDPEIFFRLGVTIIDPPKNSVARKDLVTKLVAAVKDDLQVIAQETTEAELREEGFWRWAGKTAWYNIMDLRKTLDWATGQKIDPLIHRPSYDFSAPPVFDEEGLENDVPGPEFDEHAVKTPTEELSMLPSEFDSFNSQETSFPGSSPLSKIVEEPFAEEEFQVVTKKTRRQKTQAPAPTPTPRAIRPVKNLAARKSLAESQRLSGGGYHEDADFTPEAMASRFASHGSKADTPEFTNSVYRGAKRQTFTPRQ